MKQTRKLLGLAAAAAMMLAASQSTLWAESAAPLGSALDFFPPPTDAYYDPQAAGTKYSGTLAMSYDKASVGECDIFLVNKMSVVLTLQQGNVRRVFTTASENFCFENQLAQVQVILDLIRDKVIPLVCPNCTPSGFKVKSLTNFDFTTVDTSADISTKSASADITIAVQ